MKIPCSEPQRHVAYMDVHVPHQIPFKPILEFQKSYRPTHIVLNGDIMNGEWASHWNEGTFKEIGYGIIRRNMMQEFEATQDFIADIRRASPKAQLYFVPGNHELHFYWAALYHPQLLISPELGDPAKLHFKSDMAARANDALKIILEKHLKAAQLRMQVLPYMDELQIGKIVYLHGNQLTISNSPRLYPNKNIVFGHYHTHHVITLNDNGDGDVVQHNAVPCLTALGPKKPGYLGSKSTRWLNGFWIADVLANGLFDGRVKKVLGGTVMIP